MKLLYIFIFSLLFSVDLQAQHIDSIFVNLYTDSLKKGTYNYINVDAKMSDGTYLPLDSNQLRFVADEGKFYGNSLWLAPDFKPSKVKLKIYRKDTGALVSDFEMYIKLKNDEPLKTEQQILDEIKKKKKGK